MLVLSIWNFTFDFIPSRTPHLNLLAYTNLIRTRAATAHRDLIFDHGLAKRRKIAHWSLRSCRTLTRIKAAHLKLFILATR